METGHLGRRRFSSAEVAENFDGSSPRDYHNLVCDDATIPIRLGLVSLYCWTNPDLAIEFGNLDSVFCILASAPWVPLASDVCPCDDEPSHDFVLHR